MQLKKPNNPKTDTHPDTPKISKASSFGRFFRAGALGLTMLATSVSCQTKTEIKESEIVEMLDGLKKGDLNFRYNFCRWVIEKKIKDERIGDALVELALRDGNINVSGGAATALGKMGYDETARIVAALNDGDRHVRSRAIGALRRIGDESAVAALIKLLGGNAHWGARSALATIGKPAVPALIKALKHENPDVREAAAYVLGGIPNTSTTHVLNTLLDDGDEYVRAAAAEALGNLKAESAVPALVRKLKDKDEVVRTKVAAALGNIGDSSAVRPLLQALRDDRNLEAINALENIGKAAVPALIEALRIENQYIVEGAARILGDMGEASAVPGLVEALQVKNRGVRYELVTALGKIGKPAIPELIRVLKSGDPFVRAAAAHALGNTRDELARAPLTEALNDKNSEVRYAAVEALAKITPKQ